MNAASASARRSAQAWLAVIPAMGMMAAGAATAAATTAPTALSGDEQQIVAADTVELSSFDRQIKRAALLMARLSQAR